MSVAPPSGQNRIMIIRSLTGRERIAAPNLVKRKNRNRPMKKAAVSNTLARFM
jgi:hypothetical protein